jgi:hypothetical protein
MSENLAPFVFRTPRLRSLLLPRTTEESKGAIEDGKGAKVRITFDDARSGSIELDVTAHAAHQMGRKGRPRLRT